MKKILFILFLSITLFKMQAQAAPKAGDTLYKKPCYFEDSCQLTINIDTTHGGLWQIGATHKTFFGSAYSKPFAIMTDTANTYKPGVKSYFDVVIPHAFSYWGDVGFTFTHKFQTFLHKDGGYLQYSFDQGKSWFLLGQRDTATGLPMIMKTTSYQYNDTLNNGIQAYTGSQNNWQTTSIYMQKYVIVRVKHDPDTLMLRFNFVSDSTNNAGNNDGWIIDNMKAWSVELSGAVNEIQEGAQIHLWPNPASELVTITIGNAVRGSLEVKVIDMLGKELITKSYSVTDNIQLPVNELENGFYFLQLWQHEKLLSKEKMVISRQ